MLIICPKCFSRFETPSSLIKKPTQKFKCSACGEIFEEHFSDVIDLTQKAIEVPVNHALETQASKNQFGWDISAGTPPVPEEFTPVFEKNKKSYGWIFWLIFFLIIAGIGGYGYFNRSELLSSFPEVEKGMALLNAPEEVNPGTDPLKVYPSAETAPTESAPTTEAASEGVIEPVAPVLNEAPVLGQQPAPEMLGDGVLPTSQEMNDKLSLPAPQVADSTVSIAADKAPVQIKDVVFRLDDTGTGTGRLFVQGIVNNVTENALPMPALQAQLYDKDNVLLGVRDLPYTPRGLNGKMAEFFFAEIEQLPTGIVSRVSVVVKGK